jgi:enterochelin esterase-like enzyme
VSLTGSGLIVALVVLSLLAAVGAALLWNRLSRTGPFQWPLRISMIISCQVTACVLAAAVLNDAGQFYTSWSELVGHTGTVTAQALPPGAEKVVITQQLVHHSAGHSAIVKVEVPTAGTKTSQTALVYLPAAYFDPANANRQFPVVELLDGSPGSPQSWTGPLDMQNIADAEIASGRATPFLAVMPVQNWLPIGRDAECVNAVNGTQAETTLADNVRSVMLDSFRVSAARSSWALMGYSTGGYCALNMGLHHPNWYATIVDEAGNTSPYQDITTGSLFQGDQGVQNYNDPLWQVQHGRSPDLNLLIIVGDRDEQPLRETKQFLPFVKTPMHVFDFFMPRGGHTFHTFKMYEPLAFDWISARLSPALAPSVAIDNLDPVPYTSDQVLPPQPPTTVLASGRRPHSHPRRKNPALVKNRHKHSAAHPATLRGLTRGYLQIKF